MITVPDHALGESLDKYLNTPLRTLVNLALKHGAYHEELRFGNGVVDIMVTWDGAHG